MCIKYKCVWLWVGGYVGLSEYVYALSRSSFKHDVHRLPSVLHVSYFLVSYLFNSELDFCINMEKVYGRK